MLPRKQKTLIILIIYTDHRGVGKYRIATGNVTQDRFDYDSHGAFFERLMSFNLDFVGNISVILRLSLKAKLRQIKLSLIRVKQVPC